MGNSSMDFITLQETFDELLHNPLLRVETNLELRADALDTLSYIQDVITHNPQVAVLSNLSAKVSRLSMELEVINLRIFDETRELIKSPNSSPASLRAFLNRYTKYQPCEDGHIHIDYEALDVLISGTLFPDVVPTPFMDLFPEMVHWEASPGSVILDMVDHVPFQSEDIFFDIGSGLGNIAVLVNVLTGLRTVGIEREPVYCEYAWNLATSLKLDNVTFVNKDAREAQLQSGTIFYLFTPFVASILNEVMGKIYTVSQHHTVFVISFGPCTAEIAKLSWLTPISKDTQHQFKLVIFRS